MFFDKFLHKPSLRTLENFLEIRNNVREFGIKNFKDLLVSKGILNQDYTLPVNGSFFPREVAKTEESHILFPNLQWKDKVWFSGKEEHIGRASMSKTRKLLVLRDFGYQNFNVLLLGIENNIEMKQCAIQTINLIEKISFTYCDDLGIDEQNMLLCFHCYPTNSVHITHVHILDSTCLSPSYYYNFLKNMPLDIVRSTLLHELSLI